MFGRTAGTTRTNCRSPFVFWCATRRRNARWRSQRPRCSMSTRRRNAPGPKMPRIAFTRPSMLRPMHHPALVQSRQMKDRHRMAPKTRPKIQRRIYSGRGALDSRRARGAGCDLHALCRQCRDQSRGEQRPHSSRRVRFGGARADGLLPGRRKAGGAADQRDIQLPRRQLECRGRFPVRSGEDRSQFGAAAAVGGLVPGARRVT